jgi:hypothetical protein
MFKPSPTFWIVAGLIVAALEMIVPGFVIIWFGIAGVVTGILALFVHNPLIQMAVFFVLSGVMVFTSQIISRRITKPEPEPVGSYRLNGAEGTVLQTIEPPRVGRVKVIGEEWRAEAQTRLDVGVKVKVLRVEGTRVIVEPLEKRSN